MTDHQNNKPDSSVKTPGQRMVEVESKIDVLMEKLALHNEKVIQAVSDLKIAIAEITGGMNVLRSKQEDQVSDWNRDFRAHKDLVRSEIEKAKTDCNRGYNELKEILIPLEAKIGKYERKAVKWILSFGVGSTVLVLIFNIDIIVLYLKKLFGIV